MDVLFSCECDGPDHPMMLTNQEYGDALKQAEAISDVSTYIVTLDCPHLPDRALTFKVYDRCKLVIIGAE
jgi:hypothetical protein